MAVSQDLATALCGGFNCLYFLLYTLRAARGPAQADWSGPLGSGQRRRPGGELFICLPSTSRSVWDGTARRNLLAPGPWLLARALPFLGNGLRGCV